MNNFRWGIIAPGNIANRFAEAFSAIDNGHIAAVASRNVERGNQFAEKHSIAKVYSDYDSLIASDDIDVIYIANPHRFHFETIKKCLEAKKPVLCEKPLTVNAHQAAQLIELSKQTNTFMMEALWSRFLPCWVQIKEIIDRGDIGDVDSIYSTFGFAAQRDLENRLFNLELAGGTILDLGVYNISLSRFILESPISKVDTNVIVGETGIDERCTATLHFEGQPSVTSQFTCSFLNNLENSMQINGSLGRIVVDACFWDAQTATVIPNTGEPYPINEPYEASGFEYEIEEVQRCLKKGFIESKTILHTETLEMMKIVDEILTTNGVIYPFADYV